jgi:hypothetical protein
VTPAATARRTRRFRASRRSPFNRFTMWATKKNVAYTARTDEYTLAFQFRPVN